MVSERPSKEEAKRNSLLWQRIPLDVRDPPIVRPPWMPRKE